MNQARLSQLTIVVAVVLTALSVSTTTKAACKVAVIDGGFTSPVNSGEFWCDFFNENGHECTLFPISGPTASLDPFQVIMDCSQEWTDPSGLLPDQLRAGKTVITWGFAPDALGIESNPQVQSWIGASGWIFDDAALLTVATDPIFGTLPVGSEVANCGASLCVALLETEGFVKAKPLARFEWGKGAVGIHRNSWEGGRSVYLSDAFTPSTALRREITLRMMEEACRPIPAISTWGVILLVLAMSVVGSLIVRYRRLSLPLRVLAIPLVLQSGPVIAIQPLPSVFMDENNGINELRLNSPDTAPFHATRQSILNPRIVQVGDGESAILLWDQTQPDGTTNPWYGISLDGAQVNQVSQTSNVLSLRYASFDPLLGEPMIPADLVADAANDVFLVQMVAQPIETCRRALEASGVEILAYLPENSLIAKLDTNARQQTAALGVVRSINAFHPAYRLEEVLIDELTSDSSPVDNRVYSILLWKRGDEAQQPILSRIAELGGCVKRTVSAQGQLTAQLNLNQLREIAMLPSVAFIDFPGDIEPAINVARYVSGSDYVLNATGYNGSGVRGEVMDSGLRVTHDGFENPGMPNSEPILHPGTVNLNVEPIHGTRVFGIIFGNGTGQANRRGILPAAQGMIATWYAFDDPPSSDCASYVQGGRFNHVAELVNPSLPYQAVFQSNSWGHTVKTTYTVISTEMDDIAFANNLLICQGQGNNGNSSPPRISLPEAWAKNVLSVGGFYHGGIPNIFESPGQADDKWCPSGSHGCASIGPASDGRVKPDLVHYFDNIRTTDYVSDTSYFESFGGTSAATPIVCGLAGLVYQMWREGVFNVWNGTTSVPTGGSASVFAERPKATTAKAMLINTAYQYPLDEEPGFDYGDFSRENQGWGMPEVATLYEQRGNMFIVNETDVLTEFESKTYTYTVPANSPALRVTMVYSDPPATPCAAIHRVNDLNLKVISPSGGVYWGNWGLIHYPTSYPYADYYYELLYASTWSVLDLEPGNVKKDRLNTVENVFVRNPMAGTWQAIVSADIVAQDAHLETPAFDVDYALVVSSGERAFGRCCRCIPTINCSWRTKSDCLNLDGQWFGEKSCAEPCDDNCAMFSE